MLGMSVFVLKATITNKEYMGWLSYLRYEEPDVMETQLAVLSTLVSNGLGGKAKVADFILRKDSRPVSEPNKNGISLKDARNAFGIMTTKVK